MKLSFKPVKKVLKKFKIILNFNYDDIEFQNKTNIKSILNQSGILEAEQAEDYLNEMLEFFFYDFYCILLLKNKYDINNNSNFNFFLDKILIQKIINFMSISFSKNINYLNLSNLFNLKNQFFSKNNRCSGLNNFFFKDENLIQINGKEIDSDGDNSEVSENYYSEFKKIYLQFPLYIYIYKKELKNLFLIFNLISSMLLKKYFFMLWGILHRRYSKIEKLLKFLNIIVKKHFLLNYNFYFFNKFSYPYLFTKWFFKLSLLKNFQYLYFNYFNYINFKSILNSMFGTFISYYRHHEFKKRKINFRRKIRKNILLENQYI